MKDKFGGVLMLFNAFFVGLSLPLGWYVVFVINLLAMLLLFTGMMED